MKYHYTQDYIEKVTGMAFDEFLALVKSIAASGNIDFSLLDNGQLSGDAIDATLALLETHNGKEEEENIDSEDQPQDSDSFDEYLENYEPSAGEKEEDDDKVLKSNNDGQSDTSNSETTATSAISETSLDYLGGSIGITDKPMLEAYALSQKIGNVFNSGGTLDNVEFTYTAPVIVNTSNNGGNNAQTSEPIEPANVDPLAGLDIFFGNQGAIIAGNLITDNGHGGDIDGDGGVLNVLAGTYLSDNGGIVTILDNGDFTYVPMVGFSGADSFSYTLQDNRGGEDTSEVIIALSERDTATQIDFNTATITGYGGNSQNRSDLHTVEDGGDTIHIEGNTWKDITLPYTVTADTVLEFDFMSTAISEIHGIGFDTNDGISSTYTFKVYGTQNWGRTDYNDYAGNEGQWMHFEINVGDFYTGNFNRLFFVNDDDSGPTGNSFFRNISIHEPGTGADETVTGTVASQSLYGNGGDDVIYGLDGDDVLYGGSGIDFLFGGNGADTFVFDDMTSADHVHDFNLAEGDILDISDLLIGYDPLTDAINDFVQITDNGTDSVVSVDVDGGADNFVQVATLYSATGLTDENALETSGNLITV